MTIGEFWKQQEFSYLVTYSFNRGPKLEEEIRRMKVELAAARFMRRPELQRRLYSLEHFSGKLTEGLLDLHLTATIIAEMAKTSAVTQQLAAICTASTKQDCYAGCLPVYRDALAFYSEERKLLSVFNICFECYYMATDAGVHIEADNSTYQRLRDFLVQLGHPIESH